MSAADKIRAYKSMQQHGLGLRQGQIRCPCFAGVNIHLMGGAGGWGQEQLHLSTLLLHIQRLLIQQEHSSSTAVSNLLVPGPM